MSRQGAGTSVPAPLACPLVWRARSCGVPARVACPGGRVAGVCGVAGVSGAVGSGLWAWPLCVPVGGGPPAFRPRGELRSACRLVVRPVSASAPRHSNFARNSPAACSNIEFVSLELQRFRVVLKNDRGELCATFAGVVIAVTLDPLLAADAVARPFGTSGFSGALRCLPH